MTPIALAVRSGNAPADQPPRVFTQEFTVGRHPSSGIVVANSSIVSGTHLRVVPTPQGWQIHLVSRTNGMLVDGAPNRGPVLVARPVRVQLSNASGPTFLFIPQPAGPAATAPGAPAGAARGGAPADALGALAPHPVGDVAVVVRDAGHALLQFGRTAVALDRSAGDIGCLTRDPGDAVLRIAGVTGIGRGGHAAPDGGDAGLALRRTTGRARAGALNVAAHRGHQ